MAGQPFRPGEDWRTYQILVASKDRIYIFVSVKYIAGFDCLNPEEQVVVWLRPARSQCSSAAIWARVVLMKLKETVQAGVTPGQ